MGIFFSESSSGKGTSSPRAIQLSSSSDEDNLNELVDPPVLFDR